MNLLAFDTATADTVVGLLTAGAPEPREAADHPPGGARPRHAAELLGLARGLLASAGLAFSDLDRIAVGTGPGSFTGLRIGVATARALASATGAELVGVSTLEALAIAAREGRDGTVVLAVLDARRGEAFAAAWLDGVPVFGARALAPDALAELAGEQVAGGARPWLAVGDGAIRFADQLVTAGVAVAPEDSPLHRVGAGALCRLGARSHPGDPAAVVPDYLRLPDAELQRRPD